MLQGTANIASLWQLLHEATTSSNQSEAATIWLASRKEERSAEREKNGGQKIRECSVLTSSVLKWPQERPRQ